MTIQSSMSTKRYLFETFQNDHYAVGYVWYNLLGGTA